MDDALLDLAAPPTLPSLTERAAVAELVYAGAGVGRSTDATEPRSDGATGTGLLWLSHVQGEVPLGTRSWHAGVAWDVASAAAPGKERALLYGNPELWVRGIGFNDTGLAGGGSLGFVVPLPRADADAELDDLVRVVRPWDTGYFSDTILTFRPAFDARAVLPPVVLQMRQGLDISYGFDTERADFVARIAAYVGWEPITRVTLGLELWQIYSITAEVEDDQRAAITLSPSIRLRTRPLEPGLSFLFPLSTPLEGIATAFFAARVHVRLALGDTADVTYAP